MDTTPEFVIKVESESLTRSSHGSIWGSIWCERSEICFPQRRWSDMPVAIMSWWLEATGSLIDGSGQHEVRFMDGPYIVRVCAKDHERWEAELIEDRHPRAVQQFEFAPAPYIRSLLAGADSLLARSSAEGWSSRDIDSITRHHKRLVQSLAQSPDLRLP